MTRVHTFGGRSLRRSLPFVLALGAALAIAAYLFFRILTPVEGVSVALFPTSDRTNPGSWTNNTATPCNGTPVTTCSSRIDEDIDAPNDADYAQTPMDPVAAQVTFTLLDPPFNTSAITELNVRYRAFKTGTKDSTISVEVLNASNTVLAVAPVQTITASATTYSYLITGLNLTQAEGDGLYIRVTGTTVGAGTATQVRLTSVNLDTTHSTIAPNPTLPDTCGIDIVLVIDTSGSIDNSEMTMMKDAYNDFVDSLLPGTKTNIAIVDFDTQATVTQGFTDDDTALHTAINAATADGLTNWEDALRDARNLFPHRADKPDLIVFASDGDPNTIGTNGSTSFVGENAAVHAAITQADLAKNAGIRILGLAVGSDPDISNFESITGPGAVTSTDFDELGDDLFDIAAELCGGTISVNKLIDADGNLATTGDQTSQAGWTFTADVTSGGDSSTPPSGATDGTGFIFFDIDLGGDQMADVNVVETVQPGYGLISAECHAFGNGGMGTWTGNAVNDIHLTPADITLCTFINSPQLPFEVQKDFQPDSAASVTVSISCASGIVDPASDSASEATPGEFTVTGFSGDPLCTATESPIPAGYESTGTCAALLSAGTCTIVNVLRTATVIVEKDFQPDDPTSVLVSLSCSSGTVTVVDNMATEADPAEFTVTGFDVGADCDASETAPAGWNGDDSDCQNVLISHLGTATCTIVNTEAQDTFIVYKDFTDDNPASVGIDLVCAPGAVLVEDDDTASEADPAEFTVDALPGTTCTATEQGMVGYTADNSGCVDVPLTTGSCTIVNSPVPPSVGGLVEIPVVTGGGSADGCCGGGLTIVLAGLFIGACLAGGVRFKRYFA